jgi:glycosyltransferase involved in cell wall biosynthesis
MRVLLINKFLYPKGGDAIITLDLGKLLLKKGHEVFYWGMNHPKNPQYPYSKYFVDYIDYNENLSKKQKIITAFKIIYSFEAKRKIENFINIIKPDIVHLNNFAHQISPSILDVFKKYNIPAIMTMHDYKLVCPSYSMLSGGTPCERCRNGKYYYCFINKCTKNSYSKSLLNTVEMYIHHKVLHIYDEIKIFIAPSEFLRNKIEEMGFKKKIVVLPNFVWLDEFEPSYEFEENTVCYFGRLSKEKGLFTLLNAVKGLNVKLKIIGEGPLKDELQNLAASFSLRDKENIKFLGYKTGEELKNEIKKSMFVVLPSECYENNPRAVLESFALGKPVIGSRIGGIPELVIDGLTGYTFEVGNVEDLREKILYLIKNSQKVIELGKKARKFVEENHDPEMYYKKLTKIYTSLL